MKHLLIAVLALVALPAIAFDRPTATTPFVVDVNAFSNTVNANITNGLDVSGSTVAITNTPTVTADVTNVVDASGTTVAVTNTPTVTADVTNVVDVSGSTAAVTNTVDVNGSTVSITNSSASNPYITRSDAHQDIHDGNRYMFSYAWSATADNSTNTLWVITGGTNPHVQIDFSGEGSCEFLMSESILGTNTGTTVVVYNVDRNSANTAELTAFASTGVTNYGTEVLRKAVYGGAAGQASGAGGTSEEIHLKINTAYGLSVVNRGGASKDLNLVVGFSETTD